MNRLLLSTLLIFLATSTFAQVTNPVEVIVKDGRTVILKPDGTWEFKKISPQSSTSPISTTDKPDQSSNTLPTNFKGHNAKLIFTQLLDLNKRLVKSEFETTSEFEKRISEEIKKPIAYNLGLNDTFAFVVNGVGAEYNADTKLMSFFLHAANDWGSLGLGIKRNGKESLYCINWNDEGWVGANYSIDTYKFFFNELGNFVLAKKAGSTGFSADIKLEAEDAKRLKTDVRAVAFVKFEEPYAQMDRLQVEGYMGRLFQVRLVDVYFFDPQTGKIFVKMSEAKK